MQCEWTERNGAQSSVAQTAALWGGQVVSAHAHIHFTSVTPTIIERGGGEGGGILFVLRLSFSFTRVYCM